MPIENLAILDHFSPKLYMSICWHLRTLCLDECVTHVLVSPLAGGASGFCEF